MAFDPHAPRERRAEFRFYQELNDFLPLARRGHSFSFAFYGTPSVKDAVEAIGVPHPEVDLILVDGVSVVFGHLLEGGERVAVYPVFEVLDIAPLQHLRPAPLREPRFAADANLGKLARYLRLLGFDTVFENHIDDARLVQLALSERRIILSRDIGLLKRGEVTHGYWLRATAPAKQLRELVAALQLESRCQPFTRCAQCNATLHEVTKESLQSRLPADTLSYYERFMQCESCRQLYWPGSHYRRLSAMFAGLIKRG